MARSFLHGSSVLALLASAAVLGGCAGLGPPATTSSANPPSPVTDGASPSAPAGSPAASAPPTAAAATASGPTPVPVGNAAAPPTAGLSGGTGTAPATDGQLGTFTWGDQGSDAPWIVPSTGTTATAGAELAVSFDPPLEPASWTVRWAPIVNGVAGDVASATDGTAPVVVAAPGASGAWSLQLEARFDQGHSAVWYWRVDVP